MKHSTARWIIAPFVLAFVAIMSYIGYLFVQANTGTWNAELTKLMIFAGITFVLYLAVVHYVSGLPYREGNRRATKIIREQKRRQREERRAFAEIKVRQKHERERNKAQRGSRRILTSRSSTP